MLTSDATLFYRVSILERKTSKPSFGNTMFIKVVRSNLRSLSCPDTLEVQYIVGEFVEAKVGGLLVLDDGDALAAFIPSLGFNSTLLAYECCCEQEITLPENRLYIGELIASPRLVDLLWDGKYTAPIVPLLWPKGTRAFKMVKLVRELCQIKDGRTIERELLQSDG